ncbi:MAG: hypothetical protein IKY51_03575 [Alistipes sp.]|nr:hypothetical protein [Alistipes sp.]
MLRVTDKLKTVLCYGSHHTVEAKLRNASTLLWLGRATLLALRFAQRFDYFA